jgi:hypothetical protein
MLAAAFAIGRATAPVPVAKPMAPIAPRDAAARLPDGSSDDSLQDCKRRLAFAQRVLEANEQPPYEGPVPFPDDLGPEFRPEGFDNAVNKVLQSCPDLELHLSHADCSEYPCMAFFTQPEGSWNQAVDELRACDAWQSTFGRTGGTANGSFMTDHGVVEYGMLAGNPYDENDPPARDNNAWTRFMDRVDQGKQRLMTQLGGREYTPLEQIDQQIESLQTGTEAALADLRAQRAKLVAEQNADAE